MKLRYHASWRLMHAGYVQLDLGKGVNGSGEGWEGQLRLRSRGFVNTIYKVDDHYTVSFDESFCASSSLFELRERKKRRRIKVTFQQPPGTASRLERDLVKNTVVDQKEIDVPPCVHDELAALARLRTMDLKLGERAELPVSNGKKSVSARVEAQTRQQIETPSGVYDTIRYEAFLYNNVLYRRKGRLLIWLTDDERRLPVQIRIKLGFFIGTVTLKLEEEEST
ncbi:MAG: DUF3108 domain-containing protein [bacterium]|nr:DUF3108 domain-containing protein [bacterium]